MENRLYDWIIAKRTLNYCVTAANIFIQSRLFHLEMYPQKEGDFSASSGWFKGFLRRRNLVLRRVTTTGRELPENMNSLIASFFADCMRARALPYFSLSKFGSILTL